MPEQYQDPIQTIIGGLLQGHQLASMLRHDQLQQEAAVRAEERANREASIQEIMSQRQDVLDQVRIRDAGGLQVNSGMVEEYRPDMTVPGLKLEDGIQLPDSTIPGGRILRKAKGSVKLPVSGMEFELPDEEQQLRRQQRLRDYDTQSSLDKLRQEASLKAELEQNWLNQFAFEVEDPSAKPGSGKKRKVRPEALDDIGRYQAAINPKPTLIAGRDVPLSPEVEAQRKRLNAPAPIAGRDVPVPPEVEAQRIRMNAQRAMQNGLSPNQANQAQGLATKFGNEPIVKNFNVIAEKAETVRGILNAKLGGPGDLAVVYEFMKGLDSTSVVRESERDSAIASGNIFAGAFAKFNGYLKPEGGFLPDQVKQAFMKILGEKMGVSKKQTKALYDDYARRIDNATKQPGTGKDYLTDYTALLPEESAAPMTATNPQTGQKIESTDGGKTWRPAAQ